jgi:hypothetical protein
VADRRFYSDTSVSLTNKTGRHDVAEIMLKVMFNTISRNLSAVNEIVIFRTSLIYISDLLDMINAFFYFMLIKHSVKLTNIEIMYVYFNDFLVFEISNNRNHYS